ncbi:hypothetical protein I553_6696 [Mycobacterium xenopi 4042]|uniref:Uncharacterized protein n=1 Tax=Mycobacterium xenopi 4042 TaxID=1299334 RepID=X8DCN7_MYCXE|nr:hypothetical protein I553_6696 [Mycobacterium xenopi 4042]
MIAESFRSTCCLPFQVFLLQADLTAWSSWHICRSGPRL